MGRGILIVFSLRKFSSKMFFLDSESNTQWKRPTQGNYTMEMGLGTLPLPSQHSVAFLDIKIVNAPAVAFSEFPQTWTNACSSQCLHDPAALCSVH